MISLFKVKEKQKAPLGKKETPGLLRLQTDLAEIKQVPSYKVDFPNGKDDLMNFEVTIKPDEGYYIGGKFVFSFEVPSIYPHEAPKVVSKTKVYHPNIDLEGKVCLNILREDWKPVLNISTVIYGLVYLFMHPNPEDPLNSDAAGVMKDSPETFKSIVEKSISAGCYIGKVYFPPCK
ncbi:CAAX prenyl protease [Turnera subulata]|uniref:CAAX prenyl protease n=1 Tax=Turnera subulata TaxID=218843 RepID=A0A9Q0FRG5_9ROSI|nr:CAAX prenyl protease [Turnera subulata]